MTRLWVGLLDEAGTVDALDGFVVAAEEGVPANDGNVLQHPGSVAEVADAGALVVGPAYGDFNDAVAALESDEKDLRIEAPALDGLELEDGLRGGAGKGLESALRVGEWSRMTARVTPLKQRPKNWR